MSAFLPGAGSRHWAARLADGSSGLFQWLAHGLAVGVVVGELARAMEDRQAAIDILMHTHFGFHVVVAVAEICSFIASKRPRTSVRWSIFRQALDWAISTRSMIFFHRQTHGQLQTFAGDRIPFDADN